MLPAFQENKCFADFAGVVPICFFTKFYHDFLPGVSFFRGKVIRRFETILSDIGGLIINQDQPVIRIVRVESNDKTGRTRSFSIFAVIKNVPVLVSVEIQFNVLCVKFCFGINCFQADGNIFFYAFCLQNGEITDIFPVFLYDTFYFFIKADQLRGSTSFYHLNLDIVFLHDL